MRIARLLLAEQRQPDDRCETQVMQTDGDELAQEEIFTQLNAEGKQWK